MYGGGSSVCMGVCMQNRDRERDNSNVVVDCEVWGRHEEEES